MCTFAAFSSVDKVAPKDEAIKTTVQSFFDRMQALGIPLGSSICTLPLTMKRVVLCFSMMFFLGSNQLYLPIQPKTKTLATTIARSLINSPEILMADEPTGNLDRKNGAIILDIFKKLHQKGSTIVLVTHNPLIGEMGDRTVQIIDGKIIKS